jgi:protein gp37
MAETTGIEWCDATINFWHGCTKVSEGCKYCYMYRDKQRWNQDGSELHRSSASTITTTLRELNKKNEARHIDLNKEPLKIFTCSWSDFFIEGADPWRAAAWNIIRANPQYVWIILTKRPERIQECLPEDWGGGWPNVWLCVSAENQKRFDERVPLLLKIPAYIRGVSCEPLLDRINTEKYIGQLDWLIIGGESGNDNGPWKYRPCKDWWIDNIIHEADKAGTPVFVKQLGTHIAKNLNLKSRSGGDIEEWPDSYNRMKKREFPLTVKT